MLLGIQVQNFLSFDQIKEGKPISFSMTPGKAQGKKNHIFVKGKFKTMKFMSVYGSNAAGKSNLVRVISFMQSAVRGHWPKRYMSSYFKLKPANENEVSFFEVSILLGGKEYRYGFTILLKERKFIKEWLVEWASPKSYNDLFVRNTDTGEFVFSDRFKKKDLEEKLDIYANDVSTDSSVLLLTILNRNKTKLYNDYPETQVLRDVFLWIARRLVVGTSDSIVSDYAYFSKEENVDLIYKTIDHFATGIKHFEVETVSEDKMFVDLPVDLRRAILADVERGVGRLGSGTMPREGFVVRTNRDLFIVSLEKETNNIICKTIKFVHEKPDVFFEFWEESDGTIRLLDLLEILIAGDDRTFVIDEFDSQLHPNLVREFIKLFLEQAEKRNTQLIITTHATSLLDLDLVRRDEIQMVQKDANGSTVIVPLETKKVRFDKSIAKAYLNGEYGGVPEFE